jgi:hypothetical protein
VQHPFGSQSRKEPPFAEAQRVRELLTSLYDDIGSLLSSFSDGFAGPHSPVNDPNALTQAAERLDKATNTARDVLAELDRIQNGADGRGR